MYANWKNNDGVNGRVADQEWKQAAVGNQLPM